MHLFSLTYVSSARSPFLPAELREILVKSRTHNTQQAITGLLLYKDGNIMQVLEGEETPVRTLYAKIAQDPRHHGLLILLQTPQVARHFPNWAMGFYNLNQPAAQMLPG